MSSEEAREFGLVDEVVSSRKDVPALIPTDTKS
jgi:ATP-dependent protease ClpP protease subunit